MIMVSELHGTELPQEFVDILPEYCDTCGSGNEITESLTILRCSNQMCGEKGVQRLVALLQDLGVKNMGESRCRQFMEHFGTTNPYAIFMYEPDEDGTLYVGCSQDFSDSIYEQLHAKTTMLLWEYVKIGNLPGIRDGARKLLADYDNLEEFYDDLEHGGIDFVQELYAIKGKTIKESAGFSYDDDENKEVVSVKAVAVYNTLIFYKDDLLSALDYVNIKELTTPVLNICISTGVGAPYTSKTDFVSQMNDEFGDKIHLNFLGSVSKDCQFLIWSKEGSTTSKVTKTYRINEKREGTEEEPIQILTGAEFRDYLASI